MVASFGEPNGIGKGQFLVSPHALNHPPMPADERFHMLLYVVHSDLLPTRCIAWVNYPPEEDPVARRRCCVSSLVTLGTIGSSFCGPVDLFRLDVWNLGLVKVNVQLITHPPKTLRHLPQCYFIVIQVEDHDQCKAIILRKPVTVYPMKQHTVSLSTGIPKVTTNGPEVRTALRQRFGRVSSCLEQVPYPKVIEVVTDDFIIVVVIDMGFEVLHLPT